MSLWVTELEPWLQTHRLAKYLLRQILQQLINHHRNNDSALAMSNQDYLPNRWVTKTSLDVIIRNPNIQRIVRKIALDQALDNVEGKTIRLIVHANHRPAKCRRKQINIGLQAAVA